MASAWLAFACSVIGFLVGSAWEIHLQLRGVRRRTDEASRFDVGSTITLSDGSTLRVVSTAPPEKS